MLEQFAEEFPHFLFGSYQGLPAGRCCPIKPPVPSAFSLLFGYKQSTLFEGMEQRIHGAGAELIAVPGQFFNHPEPKNLALARMVENVQADQARIEVLVSRVFVQHLPETSYILRVA